MSDQLPSIDDFTEDLSELPSSEEFIKEDLPSVEDYIESEEEDIVEETIEEPVVSEETTGDLTEILHLINAVRRDIPAIPEIKCYDEELKKLTEYIDQVHDCIPEVKYYDTEVEAICEQIDQVREEIKDLPEVKYYDEQVTNIEDRVDLLRQEVVNLPEVKYYDQEIVAICEQIDKVRSEIPIFPKWVNEVNEVPDFTWIGKTFSVIDEDFVKVGDNIKDLKDKFNYDIDTLTENLDLKDFEKKVEISEVKTNLKETKDKIYTELKETALKIWSHHDEFKDDDRKLKKLVLSKLNEARQKIETQISQLDDKNYESNKTLKKYFEGLKEEIANLPEPKYYDNPIEDLEQDLYTLDQKREEQGINIAELYKIVGELKETQQELKEVYNDRPIQPDPSEKQGNDPLTPTDQQFATLKDLAANYRLFVNRVEQQLYTIGGGGAGFIKDLDDVNIDGLANNDTLVWNASTSKWDVGTVGAGGTWASDSVGVHTTRNVGIATTARSDYALYVDGNSYFTGNVSAAGTITYDDVTNVDSVGIVTAGKGVRITTGGLVVTAGVSTLTSKLHVGVDTGFYSEDLVVNGDARITGILTIGTASITLDPNAKTLTGLEELRIGSGTTAITIKKSETTGDIEFADESGRETSVGIGTTVSINTTGIITATTFSGNLPTTDLTGTITNAQLAGSIANAKLANDSVSFGGVSLDLGGTDATPAFDLSDATNYPYASLTGITTEIVGDTSPQLGGNLDINGKYITGTGGANITGVITATSAIVGSAVTANASGLNVTGIITASSMVVSGTTGAFYPPVLNTTQRDALTVTQGAMIFNTSTSKIEFYDGSSWNSVPGVTLGLGMGVF